MTGCDAKRHKSRGCAASAQFAPGRRQPVYDRHQHGQKLHPALPRRLARRGGDEFPETRSWLKQARRAYRSGNWWGNDTCWRSALDINKILFYGTVDGRLARSPARRYFSLIDGVVSGDQAGPLEPRLRTEGVLVAGFDPLSVYQVATQIMCFDPNLIRDQQRGAQLIRYRLTRSELPIRVVSRQPERRGAIQLGLGLNFEPHYAWKEYLQSFTSATD